ncbi:WD40/YVTN/BNR-like repeat-containing protein [Chloroflexota bacterium]
MKMKFTRIMGVGLTLSLLVSLLVTGAPASAGTLSISNETDIPTTDDFVLVPVAGMDVVDMAVNGDSIFIGTGNTTYPLFKSNDGGASWTNLANSTSFPTGVSVKAVAIGPDDENTVVVVTSANEVEYSTNGGSSWTDMNEPGTGNVLVDIDVSGGSGDKYIAVCGTDGTDAEVYVLKLKVGELWKTTSAKTGFRFSDKAAAVKFSPNFDTDKIINVITGNTTVSWLQVYRHESGAETWNGAIDFFSATDWGSGNATGGLEIDDIATAISGGLGAASIALVDTYDGTEDGERVGFIAVAGASGGGGVVRATDAYIKKFETWSAGDEGPIGSVAYHDSGKLLAGDFNLNQVFVCLTPMASSPKFERINSLKQPGGATKTLVAWSVDTAVAGTYGDESAFSVSTDDGYAFNDMSLIDTTLTNMADAAVSADGGVVYLTTYDTVDTGTNDASVWVKASSWTRVLSAKDVATANAPYMVRIAPEDSSVVYVASTSTLNIWVSKNMGKVSWKSVPCYKLDTLVVDIVVESADVAWAIDVDESSKTSNAGASWASAKPLNLPTGSAAMITMAPNGDLLVGSDSGYVAFSSDGGSSWDTTTRVSSTGTAYVAADENYDGDSNQIIYVAIANKLYRLKAMEGTQTPSSRGPSDLATGHVGHDVDTAVGIGTYGPIVYAVYASSNSSYSAVYRAMKLKTADDSGEALWSNLSKAYLLNATPQVLKISSGPKLWYVDTATPFLASTKDPIAAVGPTVIGPADAYSVPLNEQSGRAYNVTFTLERYSYKVTNITIQVAADSSFSHIIYNGEFTGVFAEDILAVVIGPTASSSTNQVEFNPGATYYWRARVAQDGPMYSPFSEIRSFTIEEAAPAMFEVKTPETGATDVSVMPTFVWSAYEGAIGYEIMVAEDSTFAIVDFSRSVDKPFFQSEEALANSTTYYWRVRGVTSISTDPKKAAPGGPWVSGIFTTAGKPAAAEEPLVIVTEKPAPPPQIVKVEVPVPQPQPIPSYLLWVIIGIGAVLVIALIVLIVRTRRVV